MSGVTATSAGGAGSEIVAGRVWEEVVRFGAEGQLLGILTRPAHVVSTRPVVLILNAGVLHRVGPHRLHVLLARRLAERGLTSVRLDLGGIGDSPSSGHPGTFTESAVADVSTVMSQLEMRLGVHRFVAFGLCSGADNGFAAALTEPRICGLVLLDPHSYRTRQSQLRKIARRVNELGARAGAEWVLRLALRRARDQVSSVAERVLRRSAPSSEVDSGGRRPPPREQLRADLTRLVERGVKVLAVYSGAYGDRYNHRDQLFELFPELRGRVDREYFPEANHLFTERAAQAALLAAVDPWLTRHFA